MLKVYSPLCRLPTMYLCKLDLSVSNGSEDRDKIKHGQVPH